MSSGNWFKRKRYGIGWTPGTAKGWILLTVYVALIVSLAALMFRDVPQNTFTKDVFFFLAATLLITVVFIWIGSKKSPTSKWRWGKKPSDNPKEDI